MSFRLCLSYLPLGCFSSWTIIVAPSHWETELPLPSRATVIALSWTELETPSDALLWLRIGSELLMARICPLDPRVKKDWPSRHAQHFDMQEIALPQEYIGYCKLSNLQYPRLPNARLQINMARTAQATHSQASFIWITRA